MSCTLEEKLREIRLKWFGHIKRSVDALVRRCEAFDLLHYRRGRGQPKSVVIQYLNC